MVNRAAEFMRSRAFAIAFGLSLFASANCGAQSLAWPGEVSSLRGVEMGLDVAGIPECPKLIHPVFKQEEYWSEYDSAYPAAMKDRLCWKTTKDLPLLRGAQALTLSNLPFITGTGREALATVINGKVESLDVQFVSEMSGTFRRALVEKYGPPTRELTREYQNRMGATFEGPSLVWQGTRVTLSFEKYAGSTKWGRITMRTKNFDAALLAEGQDAREGIKSGL